jgi:hypothetical protein
MASRQTEKREDKCWDLLIRVLAFGTTIPYTYKKNSKPRYLLLDGHGACNYRIDSSAEALLDNIRKALFEDNRPQIALHLSGLEDGPICNFWTFTFTKKGLVEAYGYYNDD